MGNSYFIELAGFFFSKFLLVEECDFFDKVDISEWH